MTMTCTCPACLRLLRTWVPPVPGQPQLTYGDVKPRAPAAPPTLVPGPACPTCGSHSPTCEPAPTPDAPLPAGGAWTYMPAGLAAALEGLPR